MHITGTHSFGPSGGKEQKLKKSNYLFMTDMGTRGFSSSYTQTVITYPVEILPILHSHPTTLVIEFC